MLHKKTIYYEITLKIQHKRKQNVFLKQIGKCGLEGLLWAKNKIIEFEEFIKTKNTDKTIKIVCGWDDNRRRNIYERSLSKLGYSFENLFNKKYLVKTVDKIKQEENQVALVFKLKGRPTEGAILNKEEIEKIGYEFKIMTLIGL